MPTITFYNDFGLGQFSLLCQCLSPFGKLSGKIFGCDRLTHQSNVGYGLRYTPVQTTQVLQNTHRFLRWSVFMRLNLGRSLSPENLTNRNLLSMRLRWRSQGPACISPLNFKRLTFAAITEFNSANAYPHEDCWWAKHRIAQPQFFYSEVMIM
jgi:hypothetical protein